MGHMPNNLGIMLYGAYGPLTYKTTLTIWWHFVLFMLVFYVNNCLNNIDEIFVFNFGAESIVNLFCCLLCCIVCVCVCVCVSLCDFFISILFQYYNWPLHC